MSRKPVPARSGERSRAEVLFDKPQLLATLFGQYDQNLVALENRLGVYITARGNRVGLEGAAENVALARDVLQDLYQRIQRGEEIDTGLVDASIAMAAEPTLDGIVSTERSAIPSIMIRTRKKTIVPRTPAQAHYMRELSTHDMIFALGPAGTGKTYIAVAQAVSQLITGSVQRLILSRPAVEAGEKLGFLPGDLNEKVDPYLAPIWEALNDILGAEDVQRRRDKGEIEAAPIAFMRGRTLSHAFVIVDEAQNTSRLQMKMVLTRLGEGARMVVTGDPSQIDLLNPRDSGLAHALRILKDVKGVGVLEFAAQDVVRHAMVERIVRAYDADAAQGRPKPDLEAPAG